MSRRLPKVRSSLQMSYVFMAFSDFVSILDASGVTINLAVELLKTLVDFLIDTEVSCVVPLVLLIIIR